MSEMKTAARRGERGSGGAGPALVQLTLVRIREFVREPEAVFWAVFFPILITAGLGVAFRSSPADVLEVVTSDEAIAALEGA